MTEKHFWPRAGAFIFDYFLASLIAFALVLPFMAPERHGLRLSIGVLQMQKCYQVTSLPQSVLDLVPSTRIDRARYCEQFVFGIPNGQKVTVRYDVTQTTRGPLTTGRYNGLTVAVDTDGHPIQTISPQAFLTWTIFMLGTVALHVRGRSSPGKALIGLRVEGQGCRLCRELRRLGLFWMFSLLAILFGLLPRETVSGFLNWLSFPAIFWLMVILLAIPFAYYILPFILWQGAAPWDKATGFRVVKTAESPADVTSQ